MFIKEVDDELKKMEKRTYKINYLIKVVSFKTGINKNNVGAHILDNYEKCNCPYDLQEINLNKRR